MFDVVVVGGGASGMLAAIHAAELGAKVCLIEKETKLGKKIYATGNGRCNLSNSSMDSSFFNTPLVERVFEAFSPDGTLQFFSSIGVNCFADGEGRMYPWSESAKDVVLALELKLESLSNLTVFLGCEVQSVEEQNGGFFVETTTTSLHTKTLIMACGAKACKKLISGETYNPKQEVLVGFACEGTFWKKLSGIRIDATLSMQHETHEFCENGQIQMRDNGISGIVVLNASAFVAKHNLLPCRATLSFLPSCQSLESILANRTTIKHLTVQHLLLGLLPSALSEVVLFQCNLTSKLSRPVSSLSAKELARIIHHIQHFEVTLLSTYGPAQVEAGGVKIETLNNLESQTTKNLFFCGESVHIYGKSGGYNLQWAWSSGALVGTLAAQRSTE